MIFWIHIVRNVFKDLIDVQTLLSVDEKLKKFEEIKKEIVQQRNMLREEVGEDVNISINCDDQNNQSVR